MKREFFGTDLGAALSKASARLGIPVEALKYTEFEERFGHSLQPDMVGILVDYEEGAGQATREVSFDFNADLEKVRDDPKLFASQVLSRTLAGLGLEATVEALEEAEAVLLKVTFDGDPPDTRRGEMRELRGALQYLVNRVSNEGREGERRFIIDFGGDLEERKLCMQALAADLADKVRQLGKPIQIGLMDPQDRRFLHLALVDHPGVATFSQGEGRFRVLCIKPEE